MPSISNDPPRRRRLSWCATVVAVTAAQAGTLPATAKGKPVTAVYEARLAGVKIGQATLNGTVDPAGAYDVEMRAEYKLLIWSGKVASRAQGRIAGDRVATSRYSMQTQAKEERSAVFGTDNGVVTSQQIDPPAKTGNRVPVTDGHRRGVFDPLSAIVIGAVRAANAPPGSCSGELPVYTGWNRFDLVFAKPEGQPSAAAMVPAGSAAGPFCQILFRPIAGHKADDKVLKAIAGSRDMRVAFRATEPNGLKLPAEISVPLWIGALQIVRR